jgi:hypothetical protein
MTRTRGDVFLAVGIISYLQPPGLNKSKPVSSAKALINRFVTGPGTGDNGRIPFTSRTGVTQVALEVMKNSSD